MRSVVGNRSIKQGRVCRFIRFNKQPWSVTIDRIIKESGRDRGLIDSTGVGDPNCREQARWARRIFRARGVFDDCVCALALAEMARKTMKG
jgi:hypothetical protein